MKAAERSQSYEHAALDFLGRGAVVSGGSHDWGAGRALEIFLTDSKVPMSWAKWRMRVYYTDWVLSSVVCWHSKMPEATAFWAINVMGSHGHPDASSP